MHTILCVHIFGSGGGGRGAKIHKIRRGENAPCRKQIKIIKSKLNKHGKSDNTTAYFFERLVPSSFLHSSSMPIALVKFP